MNIFGSLRVGASQADLVTSGQARVTASNAASRARAARRADKALLICEALWSLLRERDGLDEKVLLDRITAVDMTDGKLDGQVRRPPVECAQCKRTSPSRFDHCMYCGSELNSSAFAR